MLRILTLNLNGIRSAWSKNAYHWLLAQQADIICLQELKAQVADLTAEMLHPAGYHAFYHCAEKRGYSGVGVWCKQRPGRIVEGVGNAEFDAEGRFIQADFDGFSVVSVYLPSGSSSPERQQAKFRFMEIFGPKLATMRREQREWIICGDWNIAHREIDLKNWKSNQKNSGFLPEERAWMGELLDKQGWVDAYRQLYPDATDASYTWWSNRGQAWAKNVGWRIDCQIVTPGIAATARACEVYKQQRFSDHAPLRINYEYEYAS